MTATRKVLQRYLNKYNTDGDTPRITPQDDSLPSRRSQQYSSSNYLSLRLTSAADSPARCTPSLPLAYKAVDLSPPSGRLEKEEGFEDMEDVDFSMILKLRDERLAKRSEHSPAADRPEAEKLASDVVPAEELKPAAAKEEMKPAAPVQESKSEVAKPAAAKSEVQQKAKLEPKQDPKQEVQQKAKPEPKPETPTAAVARSAEDLDSSTPTPVEEGRNDGSPEDDTKEVKESSRRRRRGHKTFTIAPPPPSSLPPAPPAHLLQSAQHSPSTQSTQLTKSTQSLQSTPSMQSLQSSKSSQSSQSLQPSPPSQSTQPSQPPAQPSQPPAQPSQPSQSPRHIAGPVEPEVSAEAAVEKSAFPLDDQIDKVTNLLHYSTGRVNSLWAPV